VIERFQNPFAACKCFRHSSSAFASSGASEEVDFKIPLTPFVIEG
jgi:hypothetical protein